MRIQVDLDPKLVWHIQAQAERRGVTPGDVVRDELAKARHGRNTVEAVVSRVEAGMCDADIAAALFMVSGRVALIRRSVGLPANPRYKKETK